MKVLVIEDNPLLATHMKQQLHKWYIVEVARSGDEGIELAASGTFNIILLDLGLPDISGLEVCRQIRKNSKDTPIMVVSGVDTIDSRVELLDSGADDYMIKPFEVAELRARMSALTRRRKRSEVSDLIIAGDLVIDPSTRLVTRAGQAITLRRKEYDILEYLAMNQGRVISRSMITSNAWSSHNLTWAGSVDVHIKQIRDKVDRPFSHKIIKTAYGVGYMVDASAIAIEGGLISK